MANCVQCGAQLPAFSFGGESKLCKKCFAARPRQPAFPPVETISSQPAARGVSLPPLTTVIMAVNVLVFAAMVFTGVSLIEPSSPHLLRWGANWGPYSLGAQPWRILTSNYIHIGIIHIALNMWCLWSIGGMAERLFKRSTYLLLYTICGLAGSIASLLRNPIGVGAGASGAIFGIAGALIALLAFGKLPFPKERIQTTLKSLLMFAGYNLFFGAVDPRIDNAAHIGGLLAGLFMGALLAKTIDPKQESRTLWEFGIPVIALVALLSGFQMLRKADAYVVVFGRGVDAYERRDFDTAVKNLEEALASKPDDPVILATLADVYLNKSDFEKGTGVLETLTKISPKSARAWYSLGYAQIKLGRYQEAAASFQKVVTLDPSDSEAKAALAEANQAAADQRSTAQPSKGEHAKVPSH